MEQPTADGFEGIQFCADGSGLGAQILGQIGHHLRMAFPEATQHPVCLVPVRHPAPVQQQVGDARHGRGHDADPMGGAGGAHQVRHGAEAVRAGEAGAAEFHDADGLEGHGHSGKTKSPAWGSRG